MNLILISWFSTYFKWTLVLFFDKKIRYHNKNEYIGNLFLLQIKLGLEIYISKTI